jgi:hypothetical protein
MCTQQHCHGIWQPIEKRSSSIDVEKEVHLLPPFAAHLKKPGLCFGQPVQNHSALRPCNIVTSVHMRV